MSYNIELTLHLKHIDRNPYYNNKYRNTNGEETHPHLNSLTHPYFITLPLDAYN